MEYFDIFIEWDKRGARIVEKPTASGPWVKAADIVEPMRDRDTLQLEVGRLQGEIKRLRDELAAISRSSQGSGDSSLGDSSLDEEVMAKLIQAQPGPSGGLIVDREAARSALLVLQDLRDEIEALLAVNELQEARVKQLEEYIKEHELPVPGPPLPGSAGK